MSRRASLTLVALLLPLASLAAVDGADALESVDRNRNAIVADIAAGFAAHLTTDELATLRASLAGLRADRLLAASMVSSRAALDAILAEAASAGSRSAVRAKAFGDTNRDLVYHPITPCRLVDTRGFGAPITGGAFAPGARRTIVPAGACGIPGAGISQMMVSFTTQNLTPASGGYIAIVAPAAPVNTIADVFNLNSEWSGSITATPSGSAGQFDVAVNGANAHVIIDVLGYFGPPSAGAVGTVQLADGAVTGAKINTNTTITAANFVYSTPATYSLFVPHTACQSSALGTEPMGSIRAYNRSGSGYNTGISREANVISAPHSCHVNLPIAAGSTVRLTRAFFHFHDSSAVCNVTAQLLISGLPATSSNSSTIASASAGTASNDVAYTSPTTAQEEKEFPAFAPVTITAAHQLIVQGTYIRSTIGAIGDCRWSGVRLVYTVDRP